MSGKAGGRALVVAKAEEFDIVLPKVNELFIDLDREDDRAVLISGLDLLRKCGLTATVARETTSKSGNKHVFVELARNGLPCRLSGYQRIALQACLGSDVRRELLSLLSVMEPTLFFEVRKKIPTEVQLSEG